MNEMNYKFKIGDEVKIIQAGHGCHPRDLGEITTIIAIGSMYLSSEPGYKVDPAIGNCRSGACNGVIGESSFELVEAAFVPDETTAKIGDLLTGTLNPYQNIYMVTGVNRPHYNVIVLISKNLPIGKEFDLHPNKVEKIDDLKLCLKIKSDEL